MLKSLAFSNLNIYLFLSILLLCHILFEEFDFKTNATQSTILSDAVNKNFSIDNQLKGSCL